MKTVRIGDKFIGDGHPSFIVAEAGCNHNGDLELAKKLIDMAVNAQADVVKFQTYKSELLYSKQTPMLEHFRERMGFGPDATMFDLIKATELPFELHEPIVEHCRTNNIPFTSTPFDTESVDFLEKFDPPAYKIASFEITHYPLMQKVAQTGKPIILSTGMSDLGDIEKALKTIYAEGNDQVILLHCVSNYPAEPQDYNLRAMETIKRAFGVPVGISDHTPGVETALIAIAAGANLIEKHTTLDQSLPGPDHYFSLKPDQLSELVEGARRVEAMLGSPIKHCTAPEEGMKHIARRSLVAAADIKAGEIVGESAIAVKRPGFGLHPELQDVIIGSTARIDIIEDTPLSWEMFLDPNGSK